MRKARVWLILTVTALVLVAGVLIGLPEILRRVAISRLHALTGRPVTIGDVDVNLFTRTLAVENLRIAGGAGPPLAGIQRLEAHAILERRGQAEPFIRHPRLEGTITDLWLRDGAVALGRLALSGSPTIVDHRDATGAPRRDIPLAHGGGRGPACGKPARVEGAATLDRGGTATLAGTVHSVTLATDVRVTFADLDLARLRPYVPADAPATLARARGALALTYGRSAGVHIDGNATVADIAVSRAGAEPLVRAPALKIAVRDLAIKDAAVSAGSMTLAGAPSIVDTRVSPPRSLDLRAARVTFGQVTWPARGPARVELTAELPGSDTLAGHGTVKLRSRETDLALRFEDAALAPYAPFLGIDAPLDGRVDSTLAVTGTPGTEWQIRATGALTARALTLGPGEAPPVSIEHIDADGIDVRWPERLQVDRVVITNPSVLLEREKDGSFPLRGMLWRGAEHAPATSSATADRPRSRQDRWRDPPGADTLRIEIGTLLVERGEARFVDRTTTPSTPRRSPASASPWTG